MEDTLITKVYEYEYQLKNGGTSIRTVKRQVKGEVGGRHKTYVSEEVKNQIIEEYKTGKVSLKEIAAKYNLSYHILRNHVMPKDIPIVNRKNKRINKD